jgi:hypothetical protein
MLTSKIFGDLDGHATSHRLTQEAVDHIDSMIGKSEIGFHVTSYPLPFAGAFGLENDLFGPTQYDGLDGDIVGIPAVRHFMKDGEKIDREGTTPIIVREARLASHVVIIWACGLGDWCKKPTLITMYGHGSDTPAPMEPWDPNIKTEEARLDAEEFWGCHAISYKSMQLG